MRGFIAFAPVHDFSMPYLAGPLLKGYIQKKDPNVNITYFDLNLQFFKSAIKNYDELLEKYRSEVNSQKVSIAVTKAIEYQNIALKHLEKYSNKHEGHSWSLRNYRSPRERQNFQECMDYAQNSSPFDTLFSEFLNDNPIPDFFSVSLTVEDQIQPTFRLLHLARSAWPNAIFILGGNLVNRICQFMDCDQLRSLCDYIILREGERPFYKLIQWLEGNIEDIKDEPRIIDLKKSYLPSLGELDSLPKELHTDLNDDFLPNFDDINVYEYFCPEPFLPILTSRKCYWSRCQYCTIHSAWDPSHRERSPEAVVNEIETNIDKYGIKNFRIVDESMPPKLLEKISELIIKRKINCRFEMYGILEKKYIDEHFVEKITRAGCRQIFFGLESKDPKTINIMSKNINMTQDVDKIFNLTAIRGVHNYIFTMFGFPGEDLKAQNLTIDYIIKDLNIHTAIVSNFVAELESPFAKVNKQNLIHDGKMTEKYHKMRINGEYVSAIKTGSENAEKAQQIIYLNRPDLALTAFLNNETRAILSDRFGPAFAQQAIAEDSAIEKLLTNVNEIMMDERIRRQLSIKI